MDSRTDSTEDQQATPEHAAGQVPPRPGQRTETKRSGLTAGPHPEPPQSTGIEDHYKAPPDPGDSGDQSGDERDHATH